MDAGGTSKAAVFLARDLPADPATRDDLLLRIMGSPDPRQIDGIGGADPLTSKVAILSPSSRDDADVDYLFLQVFVDRPLVSDAQGCGNILAAVGPAAIERGLVAVAGDETPVRIHMANTGEVALARVATPGGRVSYAGDRDRRRARQPRAGADPVPGHRRPSSRRCPGRSPPARPEPRPRRRPAARRGSIRQTAPPCP